MPEKNLQKNTFIIFSVTFNHEDFPQTAETGAFIPPTQVVLLFITFLFITPHSCLSSHTLQTIQTFCVFVCVRQLVCRLWLIAFLSGYIRDTDSCWQACHWVCGLSSVWNTHLHCRISPCDWTRSAVRPPLHMYSFLCAYVFFSPNWPPLRNYWWHLTTQLNATDLRRPWDCEDAWASRFSEVRITSSSVIALFAELQSANMNK